MKNRFTLVDVIAAVTELKKLRGMRVSNVYDIDNKTYLIKLSRTDEKAVILFESGVRLHQTFHDWPKSQTPSSFSMKLRKHINQKRLTDIRIVGFDRLVELTFGTEERENRLYVELYDRGNVVLTDHELTILNILRVRTDKDTSVRWAVREKYIFPPEDDVRREFTKEDVEKLIPEAKDEQLGRIFANLTKCGNPVTKEILARCGLKAETKIRQSCPYLEEVWSKLGEIQKETEKIWEMVQLSPEGHITYTEVEGVGDKIEIYQEFNPIRMESTGKLNKSMGSFCVAVDEFYSRIETQKQEQKAMNMEKQALKKLENVEKDQKERIEALEQTQEQREEMANRVILNQELIEKALLLVRSALANQFSWVVIEEMKNKAAKNGDPVASAIHSFKFENNEFVMSLSDPYDEDTPPLQVPIDISLNASKNAQRYFVDKKSAAEKVKKTVASSEKAIKNAQEKAKSTLEQVKIVVEVKKSRKAMWFEKFRWFISSEGFVVVAGRDAQQNELLVKKYLRNGDIYVHADVRGASSVIIRNKTVGGPDIPPKTLTEAAQMAVCYSNAWEAGVTAAAWWVRHDQVSRTAPTGEYLPSGSFMIRGKKNFMPPSQMVMGLGILFKLDEESTERHVEKEKKSAEYDENQVKEEEKLEKIAEIAENTEEFPDIQVKIGRASLEDDEMTLIEVGPKLTPAQQQKQSKTGPNAMEKTKKYLEEKAKEEQELAGPSAKTQKRRQRKEKMVKQKYKDQTDDDLLLHESLLKPKGKIEEVEKKKDEEDVKKQPVEQQQQQAKEKEIYKKEVKKTEEATEEVEEEEDKEASAEEAGLLASLTAVPLDEDTLLFAVPVVAPYSALATYKYRVKITPGIGKRGKATKSAIELFTRQKTDRQAALIKSLLSDDAASRNLPTKVRISAPQLHAK